jgi:transposase
MLGMNEAQLRQQIAQLKKENARLDRRNQFLEEQFRLAQHKQFGASSEGHPGQGELFNEAEEIMLDVDRPEQEYVSYTRNKAKRKQLPKDLPRTRVVHDIDDADKFCGCCDSELHKIGEDISEKLEFIPAKVSVVEHVRPKYACKSCEQSGTSNQIKQAPVPPSVIPKGYATPSLLAQIITSKYQYGLPLYRQEAMFKQYGIELNRKTTSDWMMKCGDILQILYDRLKAIQLDQSVIHADETTLKVAKESKKKCYMWLYATRADSPDGNIVDANIPNVVRFDYHNSRSASCATDYLGDYQGYLQVDGYAGYHHTQATLVGCIAHARRKFTDAKTAQGKKPSGKADWALNHI